jgi:CheY-like chemotaxis protein
VAGTHPKGTAVTADGRQPHVLIINDTQEILDLMKDLLDIDKMKALAPDIIVQDIMFEHSQELGWKFLTLSRLELELARVPLALCTGATQMVKDPAMAEQLDRQGVRVILKPFNIDELLAVLTEVHTAQTLIDQATRDSSTA